MVHKANRSTVRDMREMKARGEKISMLYVTALDEAAAANAAGIRMLSIESRFFSPSMREAAGSCFVQVGLPFGPYGGLATAEDYIRAAFRLTAMGGDCFHCAASLDIQEALCDNHMPVVAHVGLFPSYITWTGWRAVGKTATEAHAVWDHVKKPEAIGCFGAELEVVPDRLGAFISKNTPMIMLDMGRGRVPMRSISSPRTSLAAPLATDPTMPRPNAIRRRIRPPPTGTHHRVQGIHRRRPCHCHHHESRSTLVAVLDISADAATKLATQYGAQTRTTDAILNDPNIDAVLIATSTDTHSDLIERATAAGKAVPCEKPVHLSLARALACQRAAARNVRPVLIGFNRRFEPNFAALKGRTGPGRDRQARASVDHLLRPRPAAGDFYQGLKRAFLRHDDP